MRSPIKWAGGKRALLPMLVEAWRSLEHRRLIEPFAGSAAFFFAVEPEAAVLGDTCVPLVNFYWALRGFPTELVEQFEVLCHEHPQPSEEHYYRVRATYNLQTLGTVGEAATFLYLNRFAFHGLWRVNARGVMNVGYGHYARPPIPTALAMHEVSRVLQAASLRYGDWAETAALAGDGDFLYLDPPYLGCWGGYSAGPEFDLEIYRALAAACLAARGRGATVVVSSRDCPIVRAIFSESDWGYVPVGIVQRIAPQNGGRQPEMLMVAT